MKSQQACTIEQWELDSSVPASLKAAGTATTNLTLRQLPAPLQSRCQRFHFKPVRECEVADWLAKRFEIPADDACAIACNNRGNVRGALLDVESYLDGLAIEPSGELVTS